MFVTKCSTSALASFRSIARFSTSTSLRQWEERPQFTKRPIGINRIELLGTLEADPQKGTDPRTGKEFMTFPIVTRTSWDRRDGTFGVNEDYHNIFVAKEGFVRYISSRGIKKGTNVFITGRLSYEPGENDSRAAHINAEVVQELEESSRIAGNGGHGGRGGDF